MLENNGISNLRRVFLFALIIVGTFVLVGCGAKSDEVAISFVEAVNARDAETTVALLSEDVVFTFGEQGTFTGRDAVQTWLEDMFIKNLKINVKGVEVIDGDVVMQNSVTMIGFQDWHIDALTGTTAVSIDGGQITGFDFQLDEASLAKWPVPVASVDEIVGDWMGAEVHPGPGVIFLQFNSDGTFRQTTGSAERLETTPLVEGTYEFIDGQVLITDETMWVDNFYLGNYCENSQKLGTYDALWLTNGNMRLEVVHEECIGRDKILMWEYEFVQ